jgi:dGTP triphosphohydrolase
MSTIRQELERREDAARAPQAARSPKSRGRLRPEDEDDLRPAFQRDRDRIIHCKAFRRLKHKTQVFFAPAGDHYRTRLTHTLEVAQIARSIAKVLALNAIAMSDAVLGAMLDLRAFLFASVYENEISTAEFRKAAGILGGLWEKVRERPVEFLDPRTVEAEGIDAAARDFLAGMTDRYAVALYEHLFIPKPWVALAGR